MVEADGVVEATRLDKSKGLNSVPKRIKPIAQLENETRNLLAFKWSSLVCFFCSDFDQREVPVVLNSSASGLLPPLGIPTLLCFSVIRIILFPCNRLHFSFQMTILPSRCLGVEWDWWSSGDYGGV